MHAGELLALQWRDIDWHGGFILVQQRLREVRVQGAVRAKIPRITPHALRHTFGTRWL